MKIIQFFIIYLGIATIFSGLYLSSDSQRLLNILDNGLWPSPDAPIFDKLNSDIILGKKLLNVGSIVFSLGMAFPLIESQMIRRYEGSRDE